MSINIVTYIYGHYNDNYYVICITKHLFLAKVRDTDIYSDSNVYMSLFIMSLTINVYM